MSTKLTSKSSVLRVTTFVWLSITLISLSGCSTPIAIVNCIDSKFKRDPVEKNFAFSIENIQTGEIETRKITCVGTYAGQCSVRGNGWHWRQKETEPYKITLSPNEDVYMRLPACYHFENDNIDKQSNVIPLTDGRLLNLKTVWGKTDDWLYPLGYKLFRDPDNEYIYYMSDDKKKTIKKTRGWFTTEEGKRAYFMDINEESNKRTPYVVPLNFSYKEL